MKVEAQKKQGGFTLLELLLVVGVGALLLIGGIATYRAVTEGNRATEGTRLLLAINAEMQSLYQGRNNFGVVNANHVPTLQGLNVVPGDDAATALHPFGDAITVATDGADTTLYSVTFTNVPSAACVRMARSLLDPEQVDSITVGGTGVADNGDLRDPDFDIIATATAPCNAAALADIQWTFR